MIKLVAQQDFNAWLDLAREVEPLFGEMVGSEDFKRGIKEFISNSSAFCAVSTDNDIEGIIAVDKARNEISWLAVKEKSRGKGYGHHLLKAALGCLDNEKPIFVQTFAPNVQAGKAARKLYVQYGFKDYKYGGKNPAGIDTIIMIWQKKCIINRV
ncbi:MAG: GNAT family N-acetyltransferase [Firmicutes bacterium]|nr:GNAT family N-acetyltransferase [Bacillota bacterium]